MYQGFKCFQQGTCNPGGTNCTCTEDAFGTFCQHTPEPPAWPFIASAIGVCVLLLGFVALGVYCFCKHRRQRAAKGGKSIRMPSQIAGTTNPLNGKEDSLSTLLPALTRAEYRIPLDQVRAAAAALPCLVASLCVLSDAPQPQTLPQQVSLEKKVGAGGSGQVWRGRYQGTVVALKQLYSHMLDPEDIDEFKKEASLLSKLRHPHIVHFYGVAVGGNDVYLITEFCPRYTQAVVSVWLHTSDCPPCLCSTTPTFALHLLSCSSLQQYLRARRGKPVDRMAFVGLLKQIALGMSYIHSKGVIHRDLKPENVLLNSAGEVRIADLGLARVIKEGTAMTVNKGTPEFMAPYVMRNLLVLCLLWVHAARSTDVGLTNLPPLPLPSSSEIMTQSRNAYTKAVDVFSFGIMMWCMWFQRRPYPNLGIFAIPHEVRPPPPRCGPQAKLTESHKHSTQVVDNNLRPPLDDTFPPGVCALAQRCWTTDPFQRPSFNQVITADCAAVASPRSKKRHAHFVLRVVCGHQILKELDPPSRLFASKGKDKAATAAAAAAAPSGGGAGGGAGASATV